MSETNSQDRQDSRLNKKLCDSGQLFRERYEVVRILGRGGFGVTHLARDRMLPGSPLCVIKQLFPKVSHPIALERAKQRFRREARILGRLGSHSQLPMLLDYFTLKGEFFLVQEYVHGDTLSREIRKNGAQKEPAVKKFLVEVLPAIQYIHRNRVIHRDIKPPNIISCRDDNRLVLLDFGAVRECLHYDDDPGDHAASPTTHFVGTMGFAPPEQLALRPTYSSDIYALGVTCLYLLTGKSPLEFDINSDTQEIAWQRSVDVSRPFERLLAKMVTTDLSERFKRIDDLQRALQLDTHYSNLERCLNRVPKAEASAQENVIDLEQIRSPIQRRAAAIRRLRQRQHMKNRPSHLFPR
ncbi:MAG: protein kinase [Leptolyngbyaceae cyanobacterium]